MSANDKPDETDPAIADTHASFPAGEPPLDSAAATGRLLRARGIRPGDTLGRYEVGEELGEGGMATVFKARDTQLRREVAVKVLFPHLARRDDVVRRFQREARAAAGLEHANILRIYDVGGAEGDDPPFIVMEIVRGRSLLQELEQRGPMLPEIAACIGALLADALIAAHAAAIVHRDIKPANVMISSIGRILLADFGVARLETDDSSLVTKTGALLGTPAYMSPEQASGDTATAKSDLYSLGVTLYQISTGALPYTGSPARVLAQIATGSLVPPVKKRAAVGPELSLVIEQLMRTEPEQRTQSAAIAAAELRAVAAAAGFGEPADELAAYFTDPDAFVAAKQPKILASVLAAGERALSDGKLPRAMALADRASSLAQNDPAVTKLIDAVARGGRSVDRKKILAIVFGGLVVVGGGTLGVVKLLGGAETAHDAAVLALAADAPLPDVALHPADAAIVDAPMIALPPDAMPTRARIDAAVRTSHDAAAAVAMALDASLPPPIDAALLIDAAVTPTATTGTLIVKSDRWCEASINGVARGRVESTRPLSLDLSPGTYKVTCSQSTTSSASWTKTIGVVAGKTVTAAGSLAQIFAVKLEIDATIDGVEHIAGTTVQLARGNREVVSARGKRFLSISSSCTLKADLQCYP